MRLGKVLLLAYTNRTMAEDWACGSVCVLLSESVPGWLTRESIVGELCEGGLLISSLAHLPNTLLPLLSTSIFEYETGGGGAHFLLN